MIVTFSKNPFRRFLCHMKNKIMEEKTKKWRNGRHVCRCHVCGDVLDSRKDRYCPEECGWMRLESKIIYDPWICHSCLEHHDSFWERKKR